MTLLHLYRAGVSLPVCGSQVERGERVTSALHQRLCLMCLAWQARRCAEIRQQHGL